METGHLITVLFGLAFVGAGLYAYAHMGRFLATAREASGTVTELVYENVAQKRRMHPVLRYTTADGREVEGRSWQHYSAEVGQKLALLYDPADPAHVEIGTLTSQQRTRLILTTVCIAFGVAIGLIGVGLELGVLNWRLGVKR
jgi:hypothetical protein